ncbi:MAG TPA: MBL fold metallo-hydrolase RNA specificity domain-containing protein [Nitrososphaeraceae archaeon]|nr:MBL fold metallo-hydrolase RNA specificity domain-containing protein [Nitrososphaeraceae archaeon]
MNHFGMNKFQCHCSGHARSKDLLQIIDEINPRELYPIHTEHPEIYKSTVKSVIEIIEGRPFSISTNIDQ